ncbi:unnamed protein product [Lactuca saligna]|uniref:Rab3 GTPase-activating protein catalytic subunit n=1 Tax=Lactuca saligna TaxID=75948 RepID=A0AA36A1F6_LACSI|nr:unnamed protein product [Lactuca saligna]
MGTIFTRRFEGDLISNQVPVKLVNLERLYELFVSKFAFSSSDLSTHFFKVHFTMILTYKTLTYDEDNEVLNSESEITESGGDNGGDNRNKLQWDDDCPWSEWYTAEDPVKAISVLESLLIREVRWCWEESQPLPRMPTKAAIDLSTSLVHKNLQMLAIYIEKKRQQDTTGDNSSDTPSVEANEDFSYPSGAKEEGLVKESDRLDSSDPVFTHTYTWDSNVVIDEAIEPGRRVTVAMGTNRQLDGLEQWLQEMSSEEEETRLQL